MCDVCHMWDDSHATAGFTAVIPKSDLEALLQGAQGQQLLQQQPPSWQNFLRALNDSGEGGREDGGTGDGAIRPFLFAGVPDKGACLFLSLGLGV